MKTTQQLILFPWEGGVVTSTDEALIKPGELTRGDNIIFDYQTNKKKRPGINRDYDNCTFSVTHRSSVGTTRTLTGTFAANGITTSDHISISGAGDSHYNGTMMQVTSISGSTLIYAAAGSLTEGSTAETNAVWANAVIGGIDYWVEKDNSKTQHVITILDNGAIYRTNSGTRTRLTDSGTSYTIGTGLTAASCEVFNNKVMIAVDGATNKVKYWDGLDITNHVQDLPNAPLGSILRAHQGRLLMNDKADLDRVHYSETGDHTIWGGIGDSGAYNYGDGDGDPEGITGISPTFKGDIFVGKKTKLYRAVGEYSQAQLIEVSSGIGFASHDGICLVDQDDLFFVSDRGLHSMNAVQSYGSFTSAFLSKDIQKTFSTIWKASRRKYIRSVYLAEINSVAFAVSDLGATTNNALWLYNVDGKWWYRWPSQECSALIAVQDGDKKRIYLGQSNARIAQTLSDNVFDTNPDGTTTPIVWTLTTGRIFPDRRPDTMKDFKRVGLIYKPLGNSTITVSVKVDNFSSQPVAFKNDSGTDLLGSTFILGQSVLGLEVVLQPYYAPIDGIGRGIQITFQQSGLNELADIQGFLVEYTQNQDSVETRNGDSS